jgi:hypothetical protein
VRRGRQKEQPSKKGKANTIPQKAEPSSSTQHSPKHQDIEQHMLQMTPHMWQMTSHVAADLPSNPVALSHALLTVGFFGPVVSTLTPALPLPLPSLLHQPPLHVADLQWCETIQAKIVSKGTLQFIQQRVTEFMLSALQLE